VLRRKEAAVGETILVQGLDQVLTGLLLLLSIALLDPGLKQFDLSSAIPVDMDVVDEISHQGASIRLGAHPSRARDRACRGFCNLDQSTERLVDSLVVRKDLGDLRLLNHDVGRRGNPSGILAANQGAEIRALVLGSLLGDSLNLAFLIDSELPHLYSALF
jgi:hypothetical protein